MKEIKVKAAIVLEKEITLKESDIIDYIYYNFLSDYTNEENDLKRAKEILDKNGIETFIYDIINEHEYNEENEKIIGGKIEIKGVIK